jgi:hypothetical protein
MAEHTDRQSTDMQTAHDKKYITQAERKKCAATVSEGVADNAPMHGEDDGV